jgi:hypothetical protein
LFQTRGEHIIYVKNALAPHIKEKRKEMNHKRKRPKQRRAGCLMCKPNKMGKGLENKLMHKGFGKIKGEYHQKIDLELAELFGGENEP